MCSLNVYWLRWKEIVLDGEIAERCALMKIVVDLRGMYSPD
jgi:hypothetical protein